MSDNNVIDLVCDEDISETDIDNLVSLAAPVTTITVGVDRSKQVARWVFTLWDTCSVNLKGTYINTLDRIQDVSYAVWQFEEGNRTHGVHLQGFIVFNHSQRMNSVKNILESRSVHVEPMRGTLAENYIYCTKDDTRIDGPWYYPDKQFVLVKCAGKKIKSIDKAIAMINGGSHMKDIALDLPKAIIYHLKGLLDYKRLLNEPKLHPIDVIVCQGIPGSGKSHWAYEVMKERDCYWKPAGKWFDDYDGERYMVIDEFDPHDYEYRHLLKMLDKFPLRVERKGSYSNYLVEHIIITSSIEYDEWYFHDTAELTRRVNKVLRFPDARDTTYDEAMDFSVNT